MKNLFLTITLTLGLLITFALPGEEAMYEGYEVGYFVEKGTGEVIINLNISDPSMYEEIKIVRSDNPVKYFRQIKLLGTDKIADLTGSDVLIDKFPLPGKTTSYYKIVTIDKTGVQKTYPCVKLAKN